MLDHASVEHRQRHVASPSLGLRGREHPQNDALLAREPVTGIGKVVAHEPQDSPLQARLAVDRRRLFCRQGPDFATLDIVSGLERAAFLVGAMVVSCASAPPPPQVVNTSEEHDAAPEEPPSVAPAVSVDAPERSARSSTKSYDEALSTPESLDVNDDRLHLTDGQLTGPMRGVLTGCRVPSKARITIKTAVQNGRAIGVTVNVRFERPKSARAPARPPSHAAARAEAKMSGKIITCIDRAVRAVTWPPSNRRDSFTTEF